MCRTHAVAALFVDRYQGALRAAQRNSVSGHLPPFVRKGRWVAPLVSAPRLAATVVALGVGSLEWESLELGVRRVRVKRCGRSPRTLAPSLQVEASPFT